MKPLMTSQSQRLCILLFWLFEPMAIVGGFITILRSRHDKYSLAAAGAEISWIVGTVGLLLVLYPLGRISKHLHATAMITCLMMLLMTMILPVN